MVRKSIVWTMAAAAFALSVGAACSAPSSPETQAPAAPTIAEQSLAEPTQLEPTQAEPTQIEPTAPAAAEEPQPFAGRPSAPAPVGGDFRADPASLVGGTGNPQLIEFFAFW